MYEISQKLAATPAAAAPPKPAGPRLEDLPIQEQVLINSINTSRSNLRVYERLKAVRSPSLSRGWLCALVLAPRLWTTPSFFSV